MSEHTPDLAAETDQLRAAALTVESLAARLELDVTATVGGSHMTVDGVRHQMLLVTVAGRSVAEFERLAPPRSAVSVPWGCRGPIGRLRRASHTYTVAAADAALLVEALEEWGGRYAATGDRRWRRSIWVLVGIYAAAGLSAAALLILGPPTVWVLGFAVVAVTYHRLAVADERGRRIARRFRRAEVAW